ncbi:EF-hand domain-containing protein [Streptomyces niveiscabiei]|uniref:EF-hand domain-containing protein n=1 Tax=Streptomyces niveiscabiei TaxID=164115 RepID=A0ABW9HGF0_9ACTN
MQPAPNRPLTPDPSDSLDANHRVKYLVFVLLPLIAVTLPLMALLVTRDEAGEPQRLALCAAALFCNVFVLLYHLLTPPHPKFMLLRGRRLAVRVHAIGGTVELAAGVVAYCVADPAVPATVVALAALVLHVPTAAWQTTIVFGSRAVMVPGYVFVILLHAYCALRLLLDPNSVFWLVNTFLVLNVYVWCRVFIGLFNALGLFPESTYSVAILLAGLVMVPAAVGFAGNLLLLGFVFAHALLYRAVLKPSPAQLAASTSERGRETLIEERVRAAWSAMTGPAERGDRQRARAVFDALDTDGSGTLTADELDAMADRCGLSRPYVHAFLERHGERGHLSFDAFHQHFYGVHRQDERPAGTTPDQAARLVFDRLDLDGSGSIDPCELRLLLLGWGLPERDIARCLHAYDTDGDGRLSFEEFRTGLRPVWQFGFHAVLSKRRPVRAA